MDTCFSYLLPQFMTEMIFENMYKKVNCKLNAGVREIKTNADPLKLCLFLSMSELFNLSSINGLIMNDMDVIEIV